AIQSDQKILLAGYTSSGSENHFSVVRYNTNGSLDNSFSGDGKQTAPPASDMQIGNSVAVQSNGKIVIAGYTLNGVYNDFAVVRFNTDGSPDNSFSGDGELSTDFTSSDAYAGSVAIQSDDKIVVAGYEYTYLPDATLQRFALTRYNTNGTPDSSFDEDGKLEGDYKSGSTRFNSTAVQTDGKIVTAGVTWNGTNYDFAVARFNTDGSPDNTFSDDGKQITDLGGDDEAVSLVIQADGKIVVAGSIVAANSNSQFAAARYNTDGSPDNTFSGDGKLTAAIGFSDVGESVALQSDGKIVIAGFTFTDSNYDSAYFAITRFNTNGTPDNTFSGDGIQLTDFGSFKSFASSVAIQTNGKIVAAGRSYLNGVNNFALARYNTDGTPDNTFSGDGKQNNTFGPGGYYITSMAIQTDGKIVAGGFSETTSGNSSSFAVARYNTNGEPDNTFSDDGFQSTYTGAHFNFGRSLAINTNGAIAIGGTDDDFTVVLYKSDGTPDSTFSGDGIQTTSIGIMGSSIQSMAFADNKLYAAGVAQFPARMGVVVRYVMAESGPLPVSLLAFKAILQNISVLLQWEIITEKNLANFVIERSADGNRFLPINQVRASGLRACSKDYSVRDEQPMQGINFYRLKMVDVEGKYTYSNIIAVKINRDNKLHIFPNPAKDILFVQANGENENAIIKIVDAAGRKIKESRIFLNSNTSFSIDINTLAPGVYNFILLKKQKTEVQTFIKK
ncbi:MAG: T9SS type A sorting domain-containing protein, partial [Ginsengibacter sp.]